MLNNKGFAVSSVLYTLLIAFLLFLGAALAQFSSSSSLIGKSNDDIVNGTQFEVTQVKTNNECSDGKWYNDSNTLVRIKSRYGTMYWPKDFYQYDKTTSILGASINSETINGKSFAVNENIGLLCSKDKINWISCKSFVLSDYKTKPSTMNYEIDGATFSKNTYDKINVIKNMFTSPYFSIGDIKLMNPYINIYDETNYNDIYEEISNVGKQQSMIKIFSLYYGNFPDYENFPNGIKIYKTNKTNEDIIFGLNNKNIYISIADKMKEDIKLIENNNVTLDIPKEIESTNEYFKNKFNNTYNSLKYPILYTDDETFAYVPVEDKIYLLNNTEVVETTYDKMSETINAQENSSTYFYIKVFDKINSGPDEDENANTIIKGLYNICE